MQEIINNTSLLNIEKNTLFFCKDFFSKIGIKLNNEIFIGNKINGILDLKLLKNINNTTFIYLDVDLKKITSKFFKEFIEEKNYGNQIGIFDYLVFFVKNNNNFFIYGIDCITKNKIKISSFKIDSKGFDDYKTGEKKDNKLQ